MPCFLLPQPLQQQNGHIFFLRISRPTYDHVTSVSPAPPQSSPSSTKSGGMSQNSMSSDNDGSNETSEITLLPACFVPFRNRLKRVPLSRLGRLPCLTHRLRTSPEVVTVREISCPEATGSTCWCYSRIYWCSPRERLKTTRGE